MLHHPNIITSCGSASKIGAVAGSPAAEQLVAGAKRNNDVGVGDNSLEARRKFIADANSGALTGRLNKFRESIGNYEVL